jgi:hypothetical protein
MKSCLLSCFLIIALNISAQQLPPISVSEMYDDFDLLRASMEEAHGGLYRFATKEATDARFVAYRKRIPAIKSKKEFISLLFEVLADTRDGHMRFQLDENTVAVFSKAKLFPISLLIEGNRAMVLYNDAPADSTIRPGMEILTINGQKINDLLQLIYPKLPSDGYIETGKQRRLEQTFGAFYWMLISEADEFAITAKDAMGKTVNTKLPGVSNADREKNRKNNPVNAQVIANVALLDGPKENVSLRYLRGNDIACLRIRGFQGQNFRQQLDSCFKALHDKKTKALILDLRGNGGGVDEYGAYLVSQFMNKPFRYFDRIHLTTLQPSFTSFREETLLDLKNGTVADPAGGYLVTPKLHKGVGEQQPAALPFQGKTFVLTDGSTFSTAADVTALMRHLTKAVFIGEETGGGFEGNTSGLNASLKLPHSKLATRIQMYEYFNAVKVVERGRGTKPDHFMPKRMTDLLQGIDAQLNRAVELALTN